MSEMRTFNGYEIVDGWAREEILRLKEASNTPTDVKYFDIDDNGIIALKSKYRGHPTADTYPLSVSDNGVGKDGSEIYNLPKRIVIPEVVNGVAVTRFADGMFNYNCVVEEIVLPGTVKIIPNSFCCDTHNLRVLENAEFVTNIGNMAFKNSHIEQALFPNLETAGEQIFTNSTFLHTVDIGNVETIGANSFLYCRSLHTVKGGENVTTIGERAFYYTVDLKTLPFLSSLNVTNVGNYAFLGSAVSFDWSKLTNCTFGTNSTPVIDNTTDYWSRIIGNRFYTPCENPLGTLLNQGHPLWTNEKYGNTSYVWNKCCGVFCVLHIHSALSGKRYTTPFEFESEVGAINPSLLNQRAGNYADAQEFYAALGYEVETITETLTDTNFKKLLNALADGAYAHISVSLTNADEGHAIIAYGVNELGEVMFVDSAPITNKEEVYDDKFTFAMPFQNITGPSSDIVIVRKP